MADTNKVKFGIKNAHYALLTLQSDGTAVYGEPVPFPGSVSLALSPEGELTPFYADNIVYYQAAGNGGYSGTWEVAKVPDDFKVDVLGYVRDDNDVLVENANAAVVPFALLFQMEGDVHARRHVLYNCVATRPDLNANTITDTKEPTTDSIPITCRSIYNSTLQIETPKASVTPSETEQYNGWFSAVYQSGGAQSTP